MKTIAERMAVLSVGLMVSMALTAADLNIAPSADAVQPLQAGDRAPSFTVHRVDGSAYYFDADNVVKPTMFITFRGGWCPYCNTQLQDLRHVIPELAGSGFDVLFLSADRPDLLYESLREENQDLGYTILSDAKLEASSALGIAFRQSDADYDRMKQFGRDLEEISGETHHALPVPSVFIVDTSGVIRFQHVDPDYRVRLSADQVRQAAQVLK